MRLLKIGQVADLLGYSPASVRRLPIPYVRTSAGGHRRYRTEDVDNYVRGLACPEAMRPMQSAPLVTGDDDFRAAVDRARRACR
jgi:hypothetical protein